MSKAKKATAGERIALRENSECLGLAELRSGKYAVQDLARRIDAAIKRAVREAYDAGFSDHEDNDAYGSEKMNKKYGTNL